MEEGGEAATQIPLDSVFFGNLHLNGTRFQPNVFGKKEKIVIIDTLNVLSWTNCFIKKPTPSKKCVNIEFKKKNSSRPPIPFTLPPS